MIDLIERIGPIVGIVAFLGAAVLAFLLFQQAREVRRLREWAGRAPERAREATEASLAVAEARGEAGDRPEGDQGEPALGWRVRLGTALAEGWRRVDRAFPFDPRLAAVGVVAIAAGAAVLTGGFGLVAGEGQGNRERSGPQNRVVAVLNATQVEQPGGTGIAGIPGLADEVADRVVRPARGFRPGRRDNAASGLDETLIMFDRGARGDAERFARTVEPRLGPVSIEPMTQEVRDRVGGAPLAIVVGRSDADF